MHPKSDSIFVYGMNRCELGLCDIRTSGTVCFKFRDKWEDHGFWGVDSFDEKFLH